MMQPTKVLLGHKALLSVAVVYTIAITIASLAPTNELPKVTYEFADKWAHLLIHMVLFLVWAIGLEKLRSTKVARRTMLYILFGCLAYGIIVEILQDVCTTYRKADILDVMANVIGSAVGWMLFWLRRRLLTN